MGSDNKSPISYVPPAKEIVTRPIPFTNRRDPVGNPIQPWRTFHTFQEFADRDPHQGYVYVNAHDHSDVRDIRIDASGNPIYDLDMVGKTYFTWHPDTGYHGNELIVQSTTSAIVPWQTGKTVSDMEFIEGIPQELQQNSAILRKIDEATRAITQKSIWDVTYWDMVEQDKLRIREELEYLTILMETGVCPYTGTPINIPAHEKTKIRNHMQHLAWAEWGTIFLISIRNLVVGTVSIGAMLIGGMESSFHIANNHPGNLLEKTAVFIEAYNKRCEQLIIGGMISQWKLDPKQLVSDIGSSLLGLKAVGKGMSKITKGKIQSPHYLGGQTIAAAGEFGWISSGTVKSLLRTYKGYKIITDSGEAFHAGTDLIKTNILGSASASDAQAMSVKSIAAADTHYSANRYDKALSLYEIAYSYDPHNPALLHKIADTFDKLNRHDAAGKFRDLARKEEAVPGSPEAAALNEGPRDYYYAQGKKIISRSRVDLYNHAIKELERIDPEFQSKYPDIDYGALYDRVLLESETNFKNTLTDRQIAQATYFLLQDGITSIESLHPQAGSATQYLSQRPSSIVYHHVGRASADNSFTPAPSGSLKPIEFYDGQFAININPLVSAKTQSDIVNIAHTYDVPEHHIKRIFVDPDIKKKVKEHMFKNQKEGDPDKITAYDYMDAVFEIYINPKLDEVKTELVSRGATTPERFDGTSRSSEVNIHNIMPTSTQIPPAFAQTILTKPFFTQKIIADLSYDKTAFNKHPNAYVRNTIAGIEIGIINKRPDIRNTNGLSSYLTHLDTDGSKTDGSTPKPALQWMAENRYLVTEPMINYEASISRIETALNDIDRAGAGIKGFDDINYRRTLADIVYRNDAAIEKFDRSIPSNERAHLTTEQVLSLWLHENGFTETSIVPRQSEIGIYIHRIDPDRHYSSTNLESILPPGTDPALVREAQATLYTIPTKTAQQDIIADLKRALDYSKSDLSSSAAIYGKASSKTNYYIAQLLRQHNLIVDETLNKMYHNDMLNAGVSGIASPSQSPSRHALSNIPLDEKIFPKSFTDYIKGKLPAGSKVRSTTDHLVYQIDVGAGLTTTEKVALYRTLDSISELPTEVQSYYATYALYQYNIIPKKVLDDHYTHTYNQIKDDPNAPHLSNPETALYKPAPVYGVKIDEIVRDVKEITTLRSEGTPYNANRPSGNVGKSGASGHALSGKAREGFITSNILKVFQETAPGTNRYIPDLKKIKSDIDAWVQTQPNTPTTTAARTIVTQYFEKLATIPLTDTSLLGIAVNFKNKLDHSESSSAVTTLLETASRQFNYNPRRGSASINDLQNSAAVATLERTQLLPQRSNLLSRTSPTNTVLRWYESPYQGSTLAELNFFETLPGIVHAFDPIRPDLPSARTTSAIPGTPQSKSPIARFISLFGDGDPRAIINRPDIISQTLVKSGLEPGSARLAEAYAETKVMLRDYARFIDTTYNSYGSLYRLNKHLQELQSDLNLEKSSEGGYTAIGDYQIGDKNAVATISESLPETKLFFSNLDTLFTTNNKKMVMQSLIAEGLIPGTPDFITALNKIYDGDNTFETHLNNLKQQDSTEGVIGIVHGIFPQTLFRNAADQGGLNTLLSPGELYTTLDSTNIYYNSLTGDVRDTKHAPRSYARSEHIYTYTLLQFLELEQTGNLPKPTIRSEHNSIVDATIEITRLQAIRSLRQALNIPSHRFNDNPIIAFKNNILKWGKDIETSRSTNHFITFDENAGLGVNKFSSVAASLAPQIATFMQYINPDNTNYRTKIIDRSGKHAESQYTKITDLLRSETNPETLSFLSDLMDIYEGYRSLDHTGSNGYQSLISSQTKLLQKHSSTWKSDPKLTTLIRDLALSRQYLYVLDNGYTYNGLNSGKTLREMVRSSIEYGIEFIPHTHIIEPDTTHPSSGKLSDPRWNFISDRKNILNNLLDSQSTPYIIEMLIRTGIFETDKTFDTRSAANLAIWDTYTHAAFDMNAATIALLSPNPKIEYQYTQYSRIFDRQKDKYPIYFSSEGKYGAVDATSIRNYLLAQDIESNPENYIDSATSDSIKKWKSENPREFEQTQNFIRDNRDSKTQSGLLHDIDVIANSLDYLSNTFLKRNQPVGLVNVAGLVNSLANSKLPGLEQIWKTDIIKGNSESYNLNPTSVFDKKNPLSQYTENYVPSVNYQSVKDLESAIGRIADTSLFPTSIRYPRTTVEYPGQTTSGARTLTRTQEQTPVPRIEEFFRKRAGHSPEESSRYNQLVGDIGKFEKILDDHHSHKNVLSDGEFMEVIRNHRQAYMELFDLHTETPLPQPVKFELIKTQSYLHAAESADTVTSRRQSTDTNVAAAKLNHLSVIEKYQKQFESTGIFNSDLLIPFRNEDDSFSGKRTTHAPIFNIPETLRSVDDQSLLGYEKIKDDSPTPIYFTKWMRDYLNGIINERGEPGQLFWKPEDIETAKEIAGYTNTGSEDESDPIARILSFVESIRQAIIPSATANTDLEIFDQAIVDQWYQRGGENQLIEELASNNTFIERFSDSYYSNLHTSNPDRYGGGTMDSYVGFMGKRRDILEEYESPMGLVTIYSDHSFQVRNRGRNAGQLYGGGSAGSYSDERIRAMYPDHFPSNDVPLRLYEYGDSVPVTPHGIYSNQPYSWTKDNEGLEYDYPEHWKPLSDRDLSLHTNEWYANQFQSNPDYWGGGGKSVDAYVGFMGKKTDEIKEEFRVTAGILTRYKDDSYEIRTDSGQLAGGGSATSFRYVNPETGFRWGSDRDIKAMEALSGTSMNITIKSPSGSPNVGGSQQPQQSTTTPSPYDISQTVEKNVTQPMCAAYNASCTGNKTRYH